MEVVGRGGISHPYPSLSVSLHKQRINQNRNSCASKKPTFFFCGTMILWTPIGRKKTRWRMRGKSPCNGFWFGWLLLFGSP